METSDQDERCDALLTLDGSFQPRGWNAEDDFLAEDYGDLSQLFRDAEGIDMETGSKSTDGGNYSVTNEFDQTTLGCAVWLERDLPSPSKNQGEQTPSTIADRTDNQFSNSNSNNSVEHCCTVEPDTSAGAWSSTTASEESDDGSRSSFSTCTVRGPAVSRDVSLPVAAPVSLPVAAPACGSTSTQQHSIVASPLHCSIPASAASGNAGATTATSPSPDEYGREMSKNKRLAVKPGPGTPLLPYMFPPGFGTAAGASTLPFLKDFPASVLAAASGVAGRAMAATSKRLRGGDQAVLGGQAVADSTTTNVDVDRVDESARLLSPWAGGEAARDAGGRATRVKRAKTKEERLMNNRAAANQSRIKKQKELSDLKARAESLSASLAEARDSKASSQKEIASLREQNSFLRGMLAAAGKTIVLPPILPTTVDSDGRKPNPLDGGGGAASASAILGAVGTGVAISCAALSTVCLEQSLESSSSGSGGGGGSAIELSGKAGGRRMLMSFDDGYQESDVGFSFGGGDVDVSEIVVRWAGAVVVFVVAAVLLVVVAMAVYNAVVRRRGGGRRRGSQGTGAVRRGLACCFWSMRKRFDASKMI